MILLGYLGAIATGFTLGLIGGGGSILIVPVFVYLFMLTPSLATAYSLFVVGITSLVGAVKYARLGLLDYRTAAIFALPSFGGVYFARSYLIPAIPDHLAKIGRFDLTRDGLIMLVFAVVMLLASVAMIRSKDNSATKSVDQNQGSQSSRFFPHLLIASEGLLVGTITGFVGAGGGFLIIPALVMLAKLPMKTAIGTSLIIIAIKSLFGFLGDIRAGVTVDWIFLVQVAVAAIVGIFAGSYAGQFIPGKKLQPAFGWFVLVMGIYILLKQLI